MSMPKIFKNLLKLIDTTFYIFTQICLFFYIKFSFYLGDLNLYYNSYYIDKKFEELNRAVKAYNNQRTLALFKQTVIQKNIHLIHPTLKLASEYNILNIIEETLDNPKFIEFLENDKSKGIDLLITALKEGNLKIANLLLKYNVIKKSTHLEINTNVLCMYCKYGLLADVYKILCDNPLILENHKMLAQALEIALSCKNDDLIHMLLKYPQVLASAHLNNNKSLYLSCEKGLTGIVEKLLQTPDVQKNIHVDNNAAFRISIKSKYRDIAEILWQYKDVQDHADYDIFLLACRNGNAFSNLVSLMLDNINIQNNAANNNNEAYKQAVFYGDDAIAELLLEKSQSVRNFVSDEIEEANAAALAEIIGNINDLIEQVNDDDDNYLESAMTQLSKEEEAELVEIIGNFNKLNEQEIEDSFNNLQEFLIAQYYKEPAKLSENTPLPLTWQEFTCMKLSKEEYNNALLAYYNSQAHTKYRYFLDPNPWMNKKAEFVDRRIINGISVAKACFDFYKPLIAQLWRAALAKNNADIALNFTEAFSQLCRAHNTDEDEYFIEGDMPSCSAGVTSRLFQAALFISNKTIINDALIQSSVYAFVANYYKDLYNNLSDGEQKELIDLIEAETAEQSEVDAKIFIKKIIDVKKSNTEESTLTYFNTVYPLYNAKTRRYVAKVISANPQIKIPIDTVILDESSTAKKYSLNDYDLKESNIETCIKNFADLYPATSTKESKFKKSHEVYMRALFNLNGDGNHIFKFYTPANLNDIFYPNAKVIKKSEELLKPKLHLSMSM